MLEVEAGMKILIGLHSKDGAMTFSITAFSISTFSITTFSITTFSITTLSIIT